METAALVAPVTALEFLHHAFLLTGEGPVLTVYSLQPRSKACSSLSVLHHYRIHGIRPRSLVGSCATESPEKENADLSSASEAAFYDLAVFGGKAVRLVRLHLGLQDGGRLHFETLGPLVELQDWALDIRWLSGNKHSLLCVALAHNRVLLLDSSSGSALAQRSCLEGCLLYSALLLVHESWEDTVLVGGTVFNQLVVWRPGGGDLGSDSEHKVPVERRLQGHSGVIFCISYLHERGWLASASDDRSVRLWGVGALGGLGGNCGDLNPACLRVLYGHQARVFSVCLSPERIFSAGEDGACLVWDWAGGSKVVRTLKGHRAGGVRSLAVSEERVSGERWVATGGADGGVRLWRVDGSEDRAEEAVTEKLSDLKFPGEGLPKVVCVTGQEGEDSWERSRFVVCTDRGAVYQYRDGQWGVVWQGPPEFQSYCVMETLAVNVRDSTAKVSLCAVGNLSGSVQVFPISHPHCGILLTAGSGKIHSLIWQETKESTYLLASGSEGLVHRWRVDVEPDGNPVSLTANPTPPFILPLCAKRWLTAAVLLHPMSGGSMWVCGDRRGSLLLFQDGVVGENIAEVQEMSGGRLCPLSCLFGVHGKQGVTSVCEHQGLLYSTGRDGCVRVFRVRPTSPEENSDGESVDNTGRLRLEVLRVQRACKGMEWLERVLILEPDISAGVDMEAERCDNHNRMHNHSLTEGEEEGVTREGKHKRRSAEEEIRSREARFVLVGFHAVHFVVWDPVRQERLLAVPCGGGHRSWSLWPHHRAVWPGYGALVFIKQGAVLASRASGAALNWPGGAGGAGGQGLREGIHGRGIGCVCRLGSISRGREEKPPTSNSEGKDGLWEIIVTGGEDTSLTVLALHPDSGCIRVLSIITDHISSVRTLATVTRQNHTQSLSALLLSAGGRAQLQCYRLLIGWDEQRLAPSCQVVQVASHRLDQQWEKRRDRHKTVKLDPETRYMSVVVVDEGIGGCVVALACSDGALRLFSVNEADHQLDLLQEMFYHQRCVLSIATCSVEDGESKRYPLLFSAATDGKIAMWDLTEVVSTSSKAPTRPIHCLNISAHQSGINSLAVWTDTVEQQGGSCLVTVASGGDDGQLTVSLIRVQYPQGGETGGSRGSAQITEPLPSLQTQSQPSTQLQLSLQAQYHIPLAHAAPLTALRLLSTGLLVSTSSDQRVCLWKVCCTGISHTGALCSHIADAAGLAVWEGERREGVDSMRKTRQENATGIIEAREKGLKMRGETGDRRGDQTGWVLVCGQGLQLLRVRHTEVDTDTAKGELSI